MQQLKILIVENTPADAALIQYLIEQDKERIAESFTLAQSYDEALDILATGVDFDLSILDVNLDGHKSFELIENFPKQRFGIVAFMTGIAIPAHINRLAQPVLQIEKPFDKAQVANFISEVKKLKKNGIQLPGQLDPMRLEKFGVLFEKGENIIVNVNQVCYVAAISKQCIFYCFDKEKNNYFTILSEEPLGKVFDRLPSGAFLQCHRSYIVNPDHIKKIIPNRGGKGGTICFEHPKCKEIPYSDNFKDVINAKFNSYRL